MLTLHPQGGIQNKHAKRVTKVLWFLQKKGREVKGFAPVLMVKSKGFTLGEKILIISISRYLCGFGPSCSDGAERVRQIEAQ